MRLLNAAKDGGPSSPVDAFFAFEIKRVGSLALLRFNKGGREAFHTHAFAALTWFLWGDLKEQRFDGSVRTYRRSIFPKVTPRNCNHRVVARTTSWCLTIRGPWADTWTEDENGTRTIFGWGRRVLARFSSPTAQGGDDAR